MPLHIDTLRDDNTDYRVNDSYSINRDVCASSNNIIEHVHREESMQLLRCIFLYL